MLEGLHEISIFMPNIDFWHKSTWFQGMEIRLSGRVFSYHKQDPKHGLYDHKTFQFLIFRVFIVFLSPLMYYILTTASPSSSPLGLPHSKTLLLLSLQKRAGLPGISTKHGIPSYNKIRHFPSYWAWTRQPRMRNRSQSRQRVRDSPAPTVRRRPARKPNNPIIYAEGLGQTHAGSLIVSSSFFVLFLRQGFAV